MPRERASTNKTKARARSCLGLLPLVLQPVSERSLGPRARSSQAGEEDVLALRALDHEHGALGAARADADERGARDSLRDVEGVLEPGLVAIFPKPNTQLIGIEGIVEGLVEGEPRGSFRIEEV
jgi:hypothetical protein